jgi:O-antigen/teichoic acid export membrane protein
MIVWLAGRPILTFLYKPEYADYPDVFLWLTIYAGISFMASTLGTANTATRHFRPLMPLFAAVAVVSALSCWVLTPLYGLLGVAFSLVISQIIMVLGSLLLILIAMRSSRDKSYEILNGKPIR